MPPFVPAPEETDPDNQQLWRKILRAEYNFDEPIWGHISTAAQQFINKLLQLEPEHRCSAEEALQDPWLAVRDTFSHH